MLSQTLEDALNDQIAHEEYASKFYLAMASWCARHGLAGAADFFFAHYEEERQHMLKLFRYVLEVEGTAKVPHPAEPPREFESLGQIVEMARDYERTTTAEVHKLVNLAQQESDFGTHNFLQWYVAEQVEEEGLFTALKDKLKLTGDAGLGLYMLDQEMAGMKAESAASQA